MAYAVKEMFLTLQGEGARAGRAAVFIRFTGCNLWSGLERDRAKGPGGCSRWCDTDFRGTDGQGGGKFSSPESLADDAARLWGGRPGRPYAVCTGGEPLLQLDDALVLALKRRDFEVAVETNGTQQPPNGLDWICVSPKAGSELVLKRGHELKLVYPQAGAEPELFEALDFEHWYLQPLDGPDRVGSTAAAVQFCLSNPKWKLSIQTHKVLGIP